MNVIDCVNPTGMSGYVLDEDGVPIVGASVMVETMYGTSTDVFGHFVLYCPPKVSYWVEVSAMGYITDFVTVPVLSQRITNVSIELKKE